MDEKRDPKGGEAGAGQGGDDSTAPEQAPSKTQSSLAATISGTLRLDGDLIRQFIAQRTHRGSLLVIAGIPADIGTHVVVEQPVIIGRELEGLQLHDSGISRQHAAVEPRDKGYVIRDLGSTNGTLVNGTRLAGERALEEGDKIFLSQTIIKFTLVDETEAAYLKQVAHLVGTDELTGLMSKHRFDASLKEALRTTQTLGSRLAAMMMDMDGLKAVNDRHGHRFGAAIIGRVGQLIGQILSGRGKACRFGGDEFSAFIPGADLQLAKLIAEQIRAEVERLRVFPEKPEVAVTISVGVAVTTPDGADPAELMHRADQALYRAKARGKNAVSD